MDKFSQLLNESTIIDFKLLWKLGLRYRVHFFIALVILCVVSSFNYYQQPVIYAVTVPIKAVSSHTVSRDLTALLPVENANVVTVSELKVSLENATFLKDYAELTIQDPDFDQLNFGAISSNKALFGRSFKRVCGKDKDCLVERLANSLRGSFSIDMGVTENRFILTVNAIDKRTVQKLTSILVKAIDLNRVHVRQYLVLKEIQSVGHLIDESRSVIQKMEGHKALEDQEKLQNDILGQKERIRNLQYNASLEMANVKSLESRVSENKRSTREIGSVKYTEYDQIRKAQARYLEIKQNISILSNTLEGKRSDSDNLIITQLKEEKARLSKILPSEPDWRSMEMSQDFIDGQATKTNGYLFEYQVAKTKYEKLNEDYEVAKAQLNEMLQHNILNESKVAGIKTDLDFLKNLEAKQMSLKLLNATMTSDLFIEDMSPKVKEFRQSTKLKIFLFSFAITSFLYFLSILVRYFFDDRIYGGEEIQRHLKNLDFIGEVPIFE